MKVTTLYFLPATDCVLPVALFMDAALRNPCGDIQISNCWAHGVFAFTTMTWFCVCSPMRGCPPPPCWGYSPCIRTRLKRDAGVSKLIARVYVLSMNFGQGELGFMACPKAKSAPTAEYSILLRLSAPMALDALLITVFASCADAAHTSSVRNTMAAIVFLYIISSRPSTSG